MKEPILNIENFGIRLYFKEHATQKWEVDVDDPEAPITNVFWYDTMDAALDRVVQSITDISLVYCPEDLPDDLERAYLLVNPKYHAGYSQHRTVQTFLKYTLEGLASVAKREQAER